MGKTYIVGPKASYVSSGRSYKPGDEIDGGLFKKEALAAAIKGGHLIERAEAPQGDGGGSGTKTLDEMTLAELRVYAAEKKIAVSGGKAETLAAIKEAEASGKEDTGGEFDELSDQELLALAAEKGIDPSLPREEILAALKNAGPGN
jgi:hypothetical protein